MGLRTQLSARRVLVRRKALCLTEAAMRGALAAPSVHGACSPVRTAVHPSAAGSITLVAECVAATSTAAITGAEGAGLAMWVERRAATSRVQGASVAHGVISCRWVAHTPGETAFGDAGPDPHRRCALVAARLAAAGLTGAHVLLVMLPGLKPLLLRVLLRALKRCRSPRGALKGAIPGAPVRRKHLRSAGHTHAQKRKCIRGKLRQPPLKE